MQPTFNPWLGYFDLIDYVDKFIFLDTVQLNQQSWQTRNKILIQNKEYIFSLPIMKTKSKVDLLYNEGFENSAKIIRSGRKYLNMDVIDFTKRS